MSAATNSTFVSINVEMKATLRASLSSFAMTSLALCFLQAAMAAASCGRLSLRLPLSVSSKLAMSVQLPSLR